MKRVTRMAAQEYEQPQVTTILLQVESGYASSSTSMLDDMKETEGEWANY